MIKSGRLDRRYNGIGDCFSRVIKQEGKLLLTNLPIFQLKCVILQESSRCGAATEQTLSATSPPKP
jgi:hypothetical protein